MKRPALSKQEKKEAKALRDLKKGKTNRWIPVE